MKALISFTLFLFALGSMLGQEIESRYENHDAFEKEAIKLTKIYDAELGFTSEQYILFQKKVEVFLIKAQIIRDTYEGKQKLDALYRLEREEIAEMDDILTRIQWKRYVEIRPDIQPLDRVKVKTQL